MSLQSAIKSSFCDLPVGKDICTVIAKYINIPTYVYVVSFIHTDDDYKPRYGKWASGSKPTVFTTRTKAKEYLKSKLVEMIENWLEERDEEEIHEYIDNRGWQDFFVNERCLQTSISLSQIEEIVNEITTGEYVQTTVEWSIDKIQVDAEPE